MTKFTTSIIIVAMLCTLVGCGSDKKDGATTASTTEVTTEAVSEAVKETETEVEKATAEDASMNDSTKKAEGTIDYMALVNKLNELPEGWEEALETVKITNSVGDEVEVEKKAYDAYLKLKEDLEKNDGIYLELDSARRSVEAQQKIMDDFTEKYGADYAAKTVATPGFSEHHTGLALDLYFILDGKEVYYNEDLVQHPDVWKKIHAKLADYGFILRYLEGREYITGYGYEPWHIRYIDDVDVAKEIMAKDITFEEYLGQAKQTDVKIDLGKSEKYTEEQLNEAVIQIKCKFATFAGAELESIRYAGDDQINEDGEVLFLMDFRGGDAGDTGDTVIEPGKEYKDYQWWLKMNDEGSWEITNFGY